MKNARLIAAIVSVSASAAAAVAAAAPRAPQPVLGSRAVPVLTVGGLRFHDLDRDGKLSAFEDWRLSPDRRVADLVTRMALEEKAGANQAGDRDHRLPHITRYPPAHRADQHLTSANRWAEQRPEDVRFYNEQGLHGAIYRVWVGDGPYDPATGKFDYSRHASYLDDASAMSDAILVNMNIGKLIRAKNSRIDFEIGAIPSLRNQTLSLFVLDGRFDGSPFASFQYSVYIQLIRRRIRFRLGPMKPYPASLSGNGTMSAPLRS